MNYVAWTTTENVYSSTYVMEIISSVGVSGDGTKWTRIESSTKQYPTRLN